MSINKIFFLIFPALIIFSKGYGQNGASVNRTLYIVRHAEKDTGSNPAISLAGQRRAGDLYRKLKRKKIDLVFVSQFRRTAMTGDSLRIYNNIDTIHYMADATGAALFQKISSLPASVKNILIIGHSNTVPAIIRMAGVADFTLKELPDHEYDNLFVVKQKKSGSVLKKEKFGAASVAPATETRMNILQ